MLTRTIHLAQKSYSITLGARSLEHLNTFCITHAYNRIHIVCDEVVEKLHLKALLLKFPNQNQIHTHIIPQGEASKSWSHAENISNSILEKGISRSDLIIAFGGGVVGDLAGFIASILLRGIDFIQIPTTLLAQVDSSIGGKTGINTTHGKNLIGAFHQPKHVFINPEYLKTLPQRHLRAGYAEIVKCALIGNANNFERYEALGAKILTDTSHLESAIFDAINLKANIVEKDETEQGDRALLNLGHTFAHAIETLCRYDAQKIIHGEAVAIGLHLAALYSSHCGLCPPDIPKRIETHLKGIGLPTSLSEIADFQFKADDFIQIMLKDKKNKSGAITLILFKSIGETFIDKTIDQNHVQSFLNGHLND